MMEPSRDPKQLATQIGGLGISLAAIYEEDYNLLCDVVSRARTGTGEVIIPKDLFMKIQKRVGEIYNERRERQEVNVFD